MFKIRKRGTFQIQSDGLEVRQKVIVPPPTKGNSCIPVFRTPVRKNTKTLCVSVQRKQKSLYKCTEEE